MPSVERSNVAEIITASNKQALVEAGGDQRLTAERFRSLTDVPSELEGFANLVTARMSLLQAVWGLALSSALAISSSSSSASSPLDMKRS